jgi:predicted secreted hydrolase
VTVLRPRRGLAIGAGLAAGGALAALLLVVAWRLGRASAAGEEESLPTARLGVAAALRAPDAPGFARALSPRPFVFPADHGPHPDFRTEWWYYTGNLEARDGRRFGFQLTFFRAALAAAAAAPAAAAPPPLRRSSAWAARQVYFAHFALTDAARQRFLAEEWWERQALGLAGARASPFRVWVGPWSATAAGPEVAGTPPVRLVAAAGGGEPAAGRAGPGPAAGAAAIDLLLTPALPAVPQGDRGLSAKSAEPGNASYYYSLPRLAAAGTLSLGDERVAVTGLAWMDREWSTSSLAADEVGWDWLGLQLDDGWELMAYRLRRRAGEGAGHRAGEAAGSGEASSQAGGTGAADSTDPASRVTLIGPDGHTELLPLGALRWVETGHWTSPASHTRYPSGWRLTLPAGSRRGPAGAPGPPTPPRAPGPSAPPLLDLTLEPLLAGQELRLSFRYWEGAVIAAGSHLGRSVAGRGYVELTGYDDAAPAGPGTR